MDFIVLGKRIRKSCNTTDIINAGEIMEIAKRDYYQEVIFERNLENDNNILTLKDAACVACKDHFSTIKSRSTAEYSVSKIVRIIGDETKLEDISAKSFFILKKSLRKEGATDCTIKKYFSFLNRILKHVNKYYGVTCYTNHQDEQLIRSQNRTRVISPEEEQQIREWFKNANKLIENWTNNDLLDLVDILFATGMRRGECFNFTVSQYHGNTIIFQPDEHKAGRYAGSKSVCLNVNAKKIIQGRIIRYKLHPKDKVFPYSAVAFTRLWNHMRKDMGLSEDRQFVPNAIRHTFASRLISKGATIYDVSKLLGHTNISTTERYAHMATDRLLEVVKLLD